MKAIRIQHQTGGQLADTLRILADFMHTRQEVRGEVRALSAEARISGKILISMPIYNRRLPVPDQAGVHCAAASTTPSGQLHVGAAALGLLLGHIAMKKLSKVEV